MGYYLLHVWRDGGDWILGGLGGHARRDGETWIMVTNVMLHRPLGLAHWAPNRLPMLAAGPLSEPLDTFQHRWNTFLVSFIIKKSPD